MWPSLLLADDVFDRGISRVGILIQLYGQPKFAPIQRQRMMRPTIFPAVKFSPRPSLQIMQPVADEQSSTLPRLLAITRSASLSDKTEVETVMPVSLTWLDKWEILEGHPEGRHRFRAPWSPASTVNCGAGYASPKRNSPSCTYVNVDVGLVVEV